VCAGVINPPKKTQVEDATMRHRYTIPAHSVRFEGEVFGSRTEAKWSHFFRNRGLVPKHEPYGKAVKNSPDLLVVRRFDSPWATMCLDGDSTQSIAVFVKPANFAYDVRAGKRFVATKRLQEFARNAHYGDAWYGLLVCGSPFDVMGYLAQKSVHTGLTIYRTAKNWFSRAFGSAWLITSRGTIRRVHVWLGHDWSVQISSFCIDSFLPVAVFSQLSSWEARFGFDLPECTSELPADAVSPFVVSIDSMTEEEFELTEPYYDLTIQDELASYWIEMSDGIPAIREYMDYVLAYVVDEESEFSVACKMWREENRRGDVADFMS
jgi:hypothetical protein